MYLFLIKSSEIKSMILVIEELKYNFLFFISFQAVNYLVRAINFLCEYIMLKERLVSTIANTFKFRSALFKELVDSPQKRTENTEEVSMIYL